MANKVQYYQYPRSEVLAIIPHEARRILDVGCGAGVLGAGLKRRQACEVTGVEIVAEAAGLAREALDRVIEGDLAANAHLLPDEHFDAIVLADVLEHLPDTDAALQIIRQKLAPDGSLVLSIPNVRHWSVVRALIEGDWKYENEGLLDRTHLRFFTHRSLIRALAQNGFFPRFTNATRFDQLGNAPAGFAELLNSAGIRAGNLQDESRDYQYLMVCGKADSIETAVAPPGDPMQARSIYYLAEYFRENGEFGSALPLYALCARCPDAGEQRRDSSLKLAVLMEQLGYPRSEVLCGYWLAFDAGPTMAEPLVSLARLYRENREFALAHLCAQKAVELPLPRDAIPVDPGCYQWRALDELGVASYWVGEFEESRRACEKLLAEGYLPESEIPRIRENLGFALQELGRQ